MDICLATDDNYVKYCATVMYSVLQNNKDIENLVFHIIHGGISEKNIEILKKFGCVKFYLADDNYFSKFLKTGKLSWPTPTLYRLKCASILDVDKVIYLDCDIIVRKNLENLWSLNLDDYYIAAVGDTVQKSCMARLKIPFDEKHFYFNAGVSFLNLKKIREDNMEVEMLDYLEKNYETLTFNDQDVLNFVLKDKVLELDNKYNYIPPCFSHQKAADEAFDDSIPIIHFAGMKPWDKCAYLSNYMNEFWQYMKNSEVIETEAFEKIYEKYKFSKNRFMRALYYLKSYPIAPFHPSKAKQFYEILLKN